VGDEQNADDDADQRGQISPPMFSNSDCSTRNAGRLEAKVTQPYDILDSHKCSSERMRQTTLCSSICLRSDQMAFSWRRPWLQSPTEAQTSSVRAVR
jgi:hypothetical protein